MCLHVPFLRRSLQFLLRVFPYFVLSFLLFYLATQIVYLHLHDKENIHPCVEAKVMVTHGDHGFTPNSSEELVTFKRVKHLLNIYQWQSAQWFYEHICSPCQVTNYNYIYFLHLAT